MLSQRMLQLTGIMLVCGIPPLSSAAELYKPGMGPREVIVIDTQIDGPNENPMPIRIYCPDAAEHFPVIIFSHGAGDTERTAPVLMHYWASNGYVCILPRHAASVKKGLGGKLKRIEEEFESDRMEKWQRRVDELHAVLIAVHSADRKLPQAAKKIDPQRIAIAGHSLGARAAMLLAGTIVYAGKDAHPVSFKENEFRAALLISPVGPDGKELTTNSWAGIDLPLMVMSGSRDIGSFKQGKEWRSDPFKFSTPGDKYQVYLNGANHLTYLGALRSANPEKYLEKGNKAAPSWFNRTFPAMSKATLFDYVCSSSLAFWDAYLKGDPAAKTFLRSGDLEKASSGLALLDRR